MMSKKIKININDPQKIWFRNLQTARENKGYTQVKLAMEAGISQQSVTFYETGTRIPSLEVAYKLSQVLGVSIDYLIGNDTYLTNKYLKNANKDDDMISMIVENKNK